MTNQVEDNSFKSRFHRQIMEEAERVALAKAAGTLDDGPGFGTFLVFLVCPLLLIWKVLRGEHERELKVFAIIWTLIWSVGVTIITVRYYSPEAVKARIESAAEADAEAAKKSKAASAREIEIRAQVLCRYAIESLAKWDYEWVGTFGMPDYGPAIPGGTAKDGGETLVIMGSGLKLQNGFGAWKRHNFLCTYNKITNSIAEAHAL